MVLKVVNLLFHGCTALDKTRSELQEDMKLWWVYNEATIACLYAYKMTGTRSFLNVFRVSMNGSHT